MPHKCELPKTDLFRLVDTTINSNCEMYKFSLLKLDNEKARDYYFYSANFLIENLIDFFKKEKTDIKNLSILDFACGYGRFTRFLIHLFKTVAVSDLEDDMLNFNKKRFGVETFKSTTNISKGINIKKKFDVVFCFSLFSHLNPEVWPKWFEAIFELVSENGYLIISVRGSKLHEKLIGKKMASDFDFRRGNETRGRLDPDYYGTFAITPNYIQNIISKIKGIEVLKHFEMGEFDLFHDIYIFRKNHNLEFKNNLDKHS